MTIAVELAQQVEASQANTLNMSQLMDIRPVQLFTEVEVNSAKDILEYSDLEYMLKTLSREHNGGE